MVERVARAMWQAEWDRARANETAANAAAGRDVFVSYVPRWEDCNLLFLGYARAAIAAMREPTEAMTRARGSRGHIRARQDWQDMIDAALSPTA